jgi:ADP-L-glycero-D-manno-heptose 6-epimerase
MILVTGGAGFIGSNIVAALTGREESVVVCDRLGRDQRWRNLAKRELEDLLTPEELPEWLRRHRGAVKAIVHMGAISSTSETDVDAIVQNNVRLTLDLLDWCAAEPTRLIYASSAATYGDGAGGFDDDSSCEALARLRPLNAYGWSKHLVDRRVARLAARGQALPPQWVGLKFFNVYGPNEYHKGSMQSVIAKNYASIVSGRPLGLFRSGRPDYPDGGQKRDFVYVKDCVDVVLWLLDQPQVSGLFNLGTGQARSWLDLAHALFDAAGVPRSIEFLELAASLKDHYQYFTEARMGRLRQAGYTRPFTSLEQGIANYVQQYLATPDPFV